MISGIIFTNRLKGLNAPSGCFCHASEPQSCHGNNMIPITFAKFNKLLASDANSGGLDISDNGHVAWIGNGVYIYNGNEVKKLTGSYWNTELRLNNKGQLAWTQFYGYGCAVAIKLCPS